MTAMGERQQFATVIFAISVYTSLGGLGPGDAPLGRMLLLIIAAGTAFAPDRWRGVMPMAALATPVLLFVPIAIGIMSGRQAIEFRDMSTIFGVLMAIYILNVLLLSIGFGLFRFLLKLKRIRA